MIYLILKKSINNVFCIVINKKGNLIAYTTCGMTGLKGPAKVTDYAAERAGALLGEKLLKKNIKKIDYLFLTIKLDRKTRGCLKGLYSNFVRIKKIVVFPLLAHNGLRKKKKKRR